MPFLKLRSIPKSAKDAMKRATTNDILLKALSQMELTFPLNPKINDAIVDNTTNPSGFQPPIGSVEELPFHVTRTKAGSLPVYTDYK
jgi:hypothetical protein